MASKNKQPSGTIALNKKARFDYELSDRYEAGLALLGWEVKSLRAGKVNITDTYVIFKNGEAFFVGVSNQPTTNCQHSLRDRSLSHAQTIVKPP